MLRFVLRKARRRKPVVLVELVGNKYFHRMQATIAEIHRQRYEARVIGYRGVSPLTSMVTLVLSRARYLLRALFGLFPEGQRWASGIRWVHFIFLDYEETRGARKVALPTTLSELENFVIDGVLVGDLIYDHYCKSHQKVSPDLTSTEFSIFFRESVAMFSHWQNYFDRNEVVAAIGNPVYRQGFVARIAIQREIPFFFGGENQVERLSIGHMYGDTMWEWYPEIFRSLTSTEQVKGLEEARETRRKLLHGELERLPYHEYLNPNHFRNSPFRVKLTDPNRPGIVILTHDVFDSTHEWGNHFQTDYYQWLVAICKLSTTIEANWFIKNHPVEPAAATEQVKALLEDFPHIVLIPPSINPAQLFSSGVRFGLTVNGTPASEYPTFGMTIFNASKRTPHSRYNFSVHPNSMNHLESLLRNLVEHTQIDEGDLNEYFFMRWIFGHQPIFDAQLEPDTHFPSPRTRSSKNEIGVSSADFLKVSDFIESSADWLVRGYKISKTQSGIEVLRQSSDNNE
jgi:hypothetical protein